MRFEMDIIEFFDIHKRNLYGNNYICRIEIDQAEARKGLLPFDIIKFIWHLMAVD